MSLVIFNDTATESYLVELEEKAKEYTGLYVDMEQLEQRKYVKEHAQTINDLLKKLDRARIDKTKLYKQKVEKEANSIKERLEIANLPFTLLIDEYKSERKKILDAEKAVKEAEILRVKVEDDHEVALLMNKTFEFDRAEEVRIQKERDDQIAKEAAQMAVEKLKAKEEKEKQDAINAENARLADLEHCAKVNRAALSDLMVVSGLTEQQGKDVIKAIINNKIFNVSINY